MKKIPRIPALDAILSDYARFNGKSWKKLLLHRDWPKCQPAGPLISLRNSGWGFDYIYQTKPEHLSKKG